MDSLLVMAGACVSGLVGSQMSTVKSGFMRKTMAQALLSDAVFDAVAYQLAKDTQDLSLTYKGTPDGDGILTTQLAPGFRIMKVQDRNILVTVNRETQNGKVVETALIQTKKKNSVWLKSYISESVKLYHSNMTSGLPIYTNCYLTWKLACRRPFRRLETIEHPTQAPAEIIRELKLWQNKEAEIVNRGENFHFGILLEGPPGTGKTSTALAIASELKRPVYLITPSVNREYLPALIESIPLNGILLVEECEELFAVRGSNSKEDKQISSLLSLFDGPTVRHGLIRIYTTNHPDKLDPAFRRLGRCDMQIHFPKRETT